MRDSYHRKILDGLDGPLDPAVFEECVCDLLNDAYPGLASVQGGADAGMDGAIGDGKGEPYPLVATTGDVRRNLRQSLSSYIDSGKKRRRAVLATSKRVTPPERRKLESIAKKDFGFTLVNVHEKRDLAHRLRRSSYWAKRLLGVTGEPPALSAVPRTRRPLMEIELVARAGDLRWLHNTQGHRLVIGQPGSGKTALLQQLVHKGNALFLVNDDETRLVEAYRDLGPSLVLVDDAHTEPKRLEHLLQIRADLDADFEIIASAWPGTEDDVASALGGIGSGSIHHLELLTRAEIVQVLRSIGVSEPDDDPYLRLLVDQSANKPGLAVTLGSLWLRGEGIDILTGNTLRRSLIHALKQVMEHDPTQLLACFALGGNLGLSQESVGEFLDLGRGEVHRRVAQAAQGGVLNIKWGLLSVQPEALRSALIDEVFFTPPSLPYRQLLGLAADRGVIIETLAVAAWRGVNVPRPDLRQLLLEGGSLRAWQAFACLGESEGRWVLEHFPRSIAEIAGQLLGSVTEPAIRQLLREAEGADGALHSHPSHSLRLLQDWVQDIPDPDELDEMLRRRKLLVETAKEYLRDGGNTTVGLRACFLALSPRLESTRWAATGDAITTRQGNLPASSVPTMLEMWTELHKDLGELTPESWTELEKTLRHCLQSGRREPTEEGTASYRDLAHQIVSDLAKHAQERPGLLSSLMIWADRIGLTLDQAIDEEFAILFPLPKELEAAGSLDEERKLNQMAKEVAARWVSRDPREVGQQLARYSTEARGFRPTGSFATWSIFRALADAVAEPEQWLDAFFRKRLPDSWLGPLLEQVVRLQPDGWEKTLEDCLEDADYSHLAGELTLQFEGIPQNLLEVALTLLPADSVETACLGKRVPLATLRFLLAHEREEIFSAAASGEWLSEPRGMVRSQIRAEWRQAMLRLGSTGRVERLQRRAKYGLKEILSSETDLAIAWLQARMASVDDKEPVDRDGVYAAAIQPLSSTHRADLLLRLPPNGFGGRLIPLMIGKSAKLYRCLLDQNHLRPHHLAPLIGRPPDASWTELASLALKANHDPRAIAEVAFLQTGARIWPGLEHWKKWETAFRDLLEGGPKRLAEVARCGLEIARARLAKAERRQRQFERSGDLLGALVQ